MARHVVFLLATLVASCVADVAAPPIERGRTSVHAVATDLALGADHTCIVTNRGALYCKGRGPGLGVGAVRASEALQRVPVTDVVDVEAAAYRTCALTRDGRVACWGTNTFGQTHPDREERGEGSSGLSFCMRGEPLDADPGNVRSRPRFIEELVDVVSLAVGSRHTCALSRSGRLTCWGQNVDGSLGAPTEGESFQRVETEAPGAVRVHVGVGRTCTYDEAGEERCFGRPAYRRQCRVTGDGALECEGPAGHCGDDERRGRWRYDRHRVVSYARQRGNCLECFVTSHGEGRCWPGLVSRLDDEGEVLSHSERVPLDDVVQLVQGHNRICARTGGGRVYCWVAFAPGAPVQEAVLEPVVFPF